MNGEVTHILKEITANNPSAFNRLLPLVYEEMRRIASARIRGERRNRTLTATDLVDETYLKLVRNERISWQDRGHFYAAVGESMRRILIDRARKRNAKKQGGGRAPIPISVADIGTNMNLTDILDLEDALERLKDQDERAYRVVILRFFACRSVEETASSLGISERTVKREWTYARSWLYRELE